MFGGPVNEQIAGDDQQASRGEDPEADSSAAFKPLIVFAAIPYGMMGALLMLWVTNAPFGFIAFLGIASLIGMIVSHVIVLFDFIEEAH